MFSLGRFVTPIVLVLLSGADARADSGWHELAAPAAALRVLDIAPESPLALSRVIRVLHSKVASEPSAQMRQLEQLLADLDRLHSAMARVPDGISMAMAAAGGAQRDAVRETLRAVGLRLREQGRVYTAEPDTSRTAIALRDRLRSAGIDAEELVKRLGAGETVRPVPASTIHPLPLPMDTWTRTVLDRADLSADALFGAIVRSRAASFLYYGVQQMTPATRAFLAGDRDLVRWMAREAAPVVAAFGGAFEVDGQGQVVVPGGAESIALWEDLTGERVSAPASFARAVFGRDSGRLAFFYHTVAFLDPARQRFALGLWLPDVRSRRSRFRALAQTFVDVDTQWSVAETPFLRPPYDPATLLTIVQVDDEGAPSDPSSRRLWTRALESDELPGVNARDMREADGEPAVDAAWLAGQLTGRIAVERRALLELFAFGQRVFARAPADRLQEVLVALRAFARYPALMLTVEGIGIRDPAVHAQVARHALSLEEVEDGSRAVTLIAQFQGSLALLERLARTGALDEGTLETLTNALAALDRPDGTYRGAIARWLRTALIPALPAAPEAAASLDERVLRALADRPQPSPSFEWEGSAYDLDFDAAFARLARVRAKQGGNSLDVVLALSAHADALEHDPHTIDDIAARGRALLADTSSIAEPRRWPESQGDIPRARNTIDRAARDLGRITRAQDTQRTRDIGRRLAEVADYLLGETLLALAYAPALGEPDVLLDAAADIAHRHTFGISPRSVTTGQPLRRTAWRRPVAGSTVAEGEALTGAVLGVEVALAQRQLRRLASNRLPGPPRLNSNDVTSLAQTVALLNPRLLADEARARIAGAIARGRARVEAAAASGTIDDVAAEARIAPARRQWLSWIAAREPARAAEVFSLGELLWLETRSAGGLAGWGLAHDALTGCRCLDLPAPSTPDILAGRESTSVLGALLPDLNLEMAVHMDALGVPAALFPSVMALAMQDYIDGVPVRFADDWVALFAHALLPREQVEDYVAAAVAQGPVRLAREAEGGQ